MKTDIEHAAMYFNCTLFAGTMMSFGGLVDKKERLTGLGRVDLWATSVFSCEEEEEKFRNSKTELFCLKNICSPQELFLYLADCQYYFPRDANDWKTIVRPPISFCKNILYRNADEE